jgi:CheY-like chemotaxis protein
MARILLSDDDAAARDLVRRALLADGHVVTVTEDGSDALEKLRADPTFEIVCTDIEMPGVDGVELAAQALAANPTIRVLLMSGFANALERAQKLDQRRVAVLAKPFSLEQVRAAVRQVGGSR